MDDRVWDRERDRLKTEIFQELREQQDRKASTVIGAQFVINPQEMVESPIRVFGPIVFQSSFKTAPTITFGQASPVVLDSNFWVIPRVESWQTASGAVEGFSLGLYAVTTVPKGLTRYIIMWHATGTASQYKQDDKLESWRMGYDHDIATQLESSDF